MKKLSLKLFTSIAIVAIVVTGIILTNSNTEFPKTNKLSSQDPFQNSIVESQYFTIDPTKEHTLEGEKGVLLVIPKNAFVDAKGNKITENVKVELAEALSLDDMILSNLTTTSDGKELETGGMLFLNITTEDGKQIGVDKENPIYVEVPTNQKKEGMQLYQGVRNENGNMNWTNPKPLTDFLIPVDIHSLNFLPNGFEEAVTQELPFRNHQQLSSQLVDSLYYSLTIQSIEENDSPYGDHGHTSDSTAIQGINPATIKVIRSEKFQNTFIATREFEKRLQALFKTCRNDLLELYINHLDKNLWEVDKMVMEKLQGTKHALIFENFYKEKLTTIEGGNQYALQLKKYYAQKVKKEKEALQKLYQEDLEQFKQELAGLYAKQNENKVLWDKELKENQEKYEQKLKESKEELERKIEQKRQKMVNKVRKLTKGKDQSKYGFYARNGGWYNIDRILGVTTTIRKTIPAQTICTINNHAKYEYSNAYLTSLESKSIFKLISVDGKNYKYYKHPNRDINLIVIGYINDKPYYHHQVLKKGEQVTIDLEPISKQKLRKLLREIDSNGDIKTNQKVIKAFSKFETAQKKLEEKYKKKEERIVQKREKVRSKINTKRSKIDDELQEQVDSALEKRGKEVLFRFSLQEVAFPCDDCGEIIGKALFQENCSACHDVHKKLVGPALGGITKRRETTWLLNWINNAPAMYESGDKIAVQLVNEHGGNLMHGFPQLNKTQILEMLEYIECKAGIEFDPKSYIEDSEDSVAIPTIKRPK